MSAVAVRELDLDLDAFEGPFDLLLTLVLKEELSLADVQVVEIIVAFLEERHEAGMSPTDLELCGEFLVLVSALLELKARVLFAEDEELELEDLDPEEAAAELAERLAEYRRIKAGANWFEERLAAEADRFFRIGPAPLAPAPARLLRTPGARAGSRRRFACSRRHLRRRRSRTSRFAFRPSRCSSSASVRS